jgi:diguanylate cyclase (GGDEF)-like protein/PAS domain S-box-containing protein
MGMMSPALPADEKARVEALAALEILDTEPEREFDAIVQLAASICGVPIALVSLIDESRQWFKARVGVAAAETPREVSYCGHAILGDGTMVVPSAALDPRFSDNPLRTGPPHVESYAGVPLRTASGHKIGTLCVIDHEPRQLSAAQQASLEALAAQVVRLLELRRAAILQRQALKSLRATDEALREGEQVAGPGEARAWSRSAWVVACVLGVASLLASLWVHATVASSRAERLQHAGERAAAFLEERVHAYGEIVRGAGALFQASQEVSASEFRAYTEALKLSRNYPGLLGLGYTERVPRGELAAWLQGIRRERPEFEVVQDGGRPELVINSLIEPLALNHAALGFDVGAEPVRAEGLLHATRTGDLALTERVRLRQDQEGGPGFLMYLPVSPRGASSGTAGWVFAVLRARDLVRSLESAAGADVRLRLLDGHADAPLFGEPKPVDASAFDVEVPVAGRRFLLETRPGPTFLSLSDRTEAWAILVLGLAATMLSFGLINAMRTTESKSQALATRMTAALRRGEHELRAVIDGTTDMILTFESDGHLVLTNRAFRSVLGYSQEQAAAMTVWDLVHPAARADFEAALQRVPAAQETQEVETRFITRNSGVLDVQGALSFVNERGQRVTRAIFRDVSARRAAERALLAANAALERLATTDGLTGLAVRRVFDEQIKSEVSRARRNGTQLCLAILDVDHFKLYNDGYGHLQGDECLRRVGAELKQVARRAGELVARYGGEEFAILLPGSSAGQGEQVAEEARRRIVELGLEHGRSETGRVTASIGVACFDPGSMQDEQALIQAADAALYQAKRGGRNRVERAA